ncbi:MAG: hypothetical protein ACOC22_02310 [bacterium]
MLIISKHKDYYDGVVGTTGVDKTIVYDRTLHEITDMKKFPKPFRKDGWSNKNLLSERFTYNSKSDVYLEASHFIIGFCGRLYLGFKMVYENPERYFNDVLIDYTYDVDEFKKHFKTSWSFADFDEFVEYIKNYDSIDIHRELNSPIFVLDSNPTKYYYNKTFIINPVLKDYQFYKVFDSFTAFQEIQMYVSGVLGVGENPMIEISDKDKITQHGFDPKWSFRKEPKDKK